MTIAAKQPAISGANQKEWKKIVDPFAKPDVRRSLWQVANSLIPYIAIWVLMYLSLDVSYWLTLLLTIPAIAFMMRLFIQFHDAGHLSFFKSRKANEVYGFIMGILVFTPYAEWRHAHNLHHSTAGNLDRRGLGDVLTYTVEEWLALPPLKRLGYRLYRHPVIMFGLGQLYMFLIAHRFVGQYKDVRGARKSVIGTNFAILGLIATLSLVFGYLELGVISFASMWAGFKVYFLIQFPIIFFGGSAGVWLFYVQHQFEGVYWDRQEDWDYIMAAMEGSSYYKLPPILQWATGSIGIHHVHHLSPRVPNYNLQGVVDADPMFQIEAITMKESVKSLKYRLFDEANNRLVGFREAKELEAERLKMGKTAPVSS